MIQVFNKLEVKSNLCRILIVMCHHILAERPCPEALITCCYMSHMTLVYVRVIIDQIVPYKLYHCQKLYVIAFGGLGSLDLDFKS